MLTLAFESSAKPASVAVVESDGKIVISGDGKCVLAENSGSKLLGQYYQNNGFSHSRTLLAMAEALLRNLDLKPQDIGLAAVANGPGSFTGVRIGVSAAKGFAFGLDIPVCAVSTLEAMARQNTSTLNIKSANADMINIKSSGADTKDDGAVILCPSMDARRGQVYNALFKCGGAGLIRLREDRAIAIDELFADLQTFDMPCLPVGDGADLVLSMQNDILDGSRKIAFLRPNPLSRYQSAYGVALAALFGSAALISANQLCPVYLRLSGAERERAAAT
ncbi:MAG: tRNA (adenosine(37)-N6)-threonylcarbamoyltransferase complex dimerization subunit type 1 TsaB [Oscillospiraceae bacterium]|nr:tRNA (adenosine(37)-N6)-threonylcarbamoyltransferase complex dimerization subunit type 1 TsaB [Oscillospiraceae bacterium]